MTAPGEPRQPLTDELVPLVYEELRKIAQHYFRRQPAGFTLRPTELVNEACIHLLQHGRRDWESSDHFRAIATHKIWQVVVDHLKRRHALKRGGRPRTRVTDPDAPPAPANETGAAAATRGAARKISLDKVEVQWHDRSVDLMDLADALEALGAQSGRLREVVMLHWFGGMNYADVGRILGVSASTAEKDFRYALAWMHRKLAGETRGD